MKLISILFFISLSFDMMGQQFSEQTNEIHINLKEQISSPLSSINWINPKMVTTFSSNTQIELSLLVESSVAISEIKLIVIHGGRPIVKNIQVESETYVKQIKQNLKLFDGENIFELVVKNEKGGVVSSARTILIGNDAISKAVDVNRKDYALLFVTNKYDYWGDLVNPVFDGETIESLLKEKYGFETEIVQDATHEEMLAKLYDYNARKFNIQDQLLIFFAGHGHFDETLGEGYVVARNSLQSDKGKSSYVPHTVLRQRIDNIGCEHILLVMDVCFGGTIDPLLARSRSTKEVYQEASEVEFLVRKLSKRTRKFLTSGSKEYVSDGIRGKHSPFAAKFVQALREVGDGDDRMITLHELRPYFEKLQTEPRVGGFGTDDPASDFVFVAK